MEQYIPKAPIVAEIERRKHKLLDNIMFERDKEWVVRTAHQLNRIILFLDTLEVKEVDFEKIWKEYFKYRGDVATVNVKYLAKHFYELGLKAQKGE